MSDKEINDIRVRICNSLNAQAGRFKYSDPWLSSFLLEIQETINILLDEIESLNNRVLKDLDTEYELRVKYLNSLVDLARLKDDQNLRSSSG